MPPGPPRAALRLWLGCVCLALVQAGKGARALRGAGGVRSSLPCFLGLRLCPSLLPDATPSLFLPS